MDMTPEERKQLEELSEGMLPEEREFLIKRWQLLREKTAPSISLSPSLEEERDFLQESYPDLPLNELRFSNWEQLSRFVMHCSESPNMDPHLKPLLAEVSNYIQKSQLASRNIADSLRPESITSQKELTRSFQKILDQIKQYRPDPSLEENMVLESKASLLNLLSFFDGQKGGRLLPPNGGEKVIDASRQYIRASENMEKHIDIRDLPLFPHEPTADDLTSGSMEHSHLKNGLLAVTALAPESIKEGMLDNNDGTVTVRFFEKNIPEDLEKEATYSPLYVRISKEVPFIDGNHSSLWAQLMERAYIASGLTALEDESIDYAESVPDHIRSLYDSYCLLDKKDLPTHQECPWLIDENGDLHSWKPSYSLLNGDPNHRFLEHFLGKGNEMEQLPLSDYQEDLPVRSGQYSEKQRDLFDLIQKKTAKGLFMSAHSISDKDGLRPGVSFNIVGVQELLRNGKPLKFLLMQKFSKEKGREYLDENGTLVSRVTDQNTDTAFPVELGDFVKEFDQLRFNEIHPTKRLAPGVSRRPLTARKIGLYIKALTDLQKRLDKAKNPSEKETPEQETFRKTLDESIKKIGKMKGKSESLLHDQLEKLATAAKVCLTKEAPEKEKETEKDPKKEQQKKDRRAVLQGSQALEEQAKKGSDDPKKSLRAEMAEAVLVKFITMNANEDFGKELLRRYHNSEEKQIMIQEILESSSFNQLCPMDDFSSVAEKAQPKSEPEVERFANAYQFEQTGKELQQRYKEEKQLQREKETLYPDPPVIDAPVLRRK